VRRGRGHDKTPRGAVGHGEEKFELIDLSRLNGTGKEGAIVGGHWARPKRARHSRKGGHVGRRGVACISKMQRSARCHRGRDAGKVRKKRKSFG